MLRFLVSAFLLSVASSTICDVAIIGAGAGGAYAAWRASSEGHSVCVFEMTSRPGGRIHSLRGQGPRKDLVVEAGGYRFAPKPCFQNQSGFIWKVDTPLTAAIINELGLPTAIYNPDASCWDHGMHKIVDSHGKDAGFLTFIERMLNISVSNGARVRYNTRVVGLAGSEEKVTLRLEGGEEVEAKAALLNIPQRPAIELLRGSAQPIAAIFPAPLYAAVSFPILKLYVHYDDAWWRNYLGLTAGFFCNTEPRSETAEYELVPTEYPVPLKGAYHDGDVRCDLADGKCRGYLQAFFGGSQLPFPGSVEFFEPYVDSISGDSVVQIGYSEPHHAHLLEVLHASLVDLHREALDAANVSEKVVAMRPTGAVLSAWTQGVAGIHAGCHRPQRLANGSDPIPGELAKKAFMPLPGWPIYVANEAFGTMHCFAEGSLAMAEKALENMNVSLPPNGWLTETTRSMLLQPETSAGRPPTEPFLLQSSASLPKAVETFVRVV